MSDIGHYTRVHISLLDHHPDVVRWFETDMINNQGWNRLAPPVPEMADVWGDQFWAIFRNTKMDTVKNHVAYTPWFNKDSDGWRAFMTIQTFHLGVPISRERVWV